MAKVEAEVVIEKPTASHRVKAAKLRKALRMGQTLDPDDAAWLADYEHRRDSAAEAVASGRSASRKVSYTEEEHAAEGTGSAAAEAAALASATREEGRRIDSLVQLGMTSLVQACGMYQQMTAALLKRTENFERAQVDMLAAMREHYLARTEAEAELVRAQAENKDGGEVSKLVEMLMPAIMAKLQGGAS